MVVGGIISRATWTNITFLVQEVGHNIASVFITHTSGTSAQLSNGYVRQKYRV